MFRKSIVIWGLILTSQTTSAQSGNQHAGEISGRVIDADSRQGIANAFVFIAYTTKGVQTNIDGFFAIAPAPEEGGEIVVAKAAYQTEVRNYQWQNGLTSVDFLLHPEPQGQNLQMQTAAESIQRSYFIDELENILLGMPGQNAQCKLINEEALDFFYNEQTKVLEAYASGPLIIENFLTGYRIIFDLANFRCFRLDEKIRYTFNGYAFFMEMIPQPEGNLASWQNNRFLAYRGSLRHFLHALSAGALAASGFAVNLAEFSIQNNAIADITTMQDIGSIVRQYNNAGHTVLKFPNFLKVVYLQNDKPVTSWLYLNKRYAIFDAKGRFIAPFDPVTVHGAWANKSLAQILPRDYIPRPINTLGYNK